MDEQSGEIRIRHVLSCRWQMLYGACHSGRSCSWAVLHSSLSTTGVNAHNDIVRSKLTGSEGHFFRQSTQPANASSFEPIALRPKIPTQCRRSDEETTLFEGALDGVGATIEAGASDDQVVMTAQVREFLPS